MLIEGSFTVPNTIQNTWKFLRNFRSYELCIEGCEKVEVLDHVSAKAEINARIAFLKAKFTGTIRVVEEEEPQILKMRAEAKDRFTDSTLRQEQTLKLSARSDTETQISYQIDVVISGRLAVVGETVIRVKAGELIKNFESRVKENLSSGSGNLEKGVNS